MKLRILFQCMNCGRRPPRQFVDIDPLTPGDVVAVSLTCDLCGTAHPIELSMLIPADPAEAAFTDYFVQNYPGPHTVITDPKWHASRIFRAAERAIERARLEKEKKRP